MKFLRHKIMNYLLDRVLILVRPEDILQERNGKTYFMDKEMTDEALERLNREAEEFREGILWKVLKADCRYQSFKKSMPTSQSENDLLGGKMMLYLLDVIETRINKLR